MLYPVTSTRQIRYRIQQQPQKTLLWSFDQRRGYLTQRAIQRLQKDQSTEKNYCCRWKPLPRCPSPTNRLIGGDNLGRRRSTDTTIRAAPATATQTTQNQAPNSEFTEKPTTIRIKKGPVTVNLFPKPPQNRRMTPWEEQEEKEIAEIFKRPRRQFLFDEPFYPFFPLTPKVNFALRFKDK